MNHQDSNVKLKRIQRIYQRKRLMKLSLKPQDDLRLETLETTETETRLPPEKRVRNEKRTAENQELPEDLLPDDKRLTIAAIGVFSVTLKDGTGVPVAVNEDSEEKQTEIKLNQTE